VPQKDERGKGGKKKGGGEVDKKLGGGGGGGGGQLRCGGVQQNEKQIVWVGVRCFLSTIYNGIALINITRFTLICLNMQNIIIVNKMSFQANVRKTSIPSP